MNGEGGWTTRRGRGEKVPEKLRLSLDFLSLVKSKIQSVSLSVRILLESLLSSVTKEEASLSSPFNSCDSTPNHHLASPS